MASNNNNNGKQKKEVMQSNLPLLFANGSPISLESMSLVNSTFKLDWITFDQIKSISDGAPEFFTLSAQVRVWETN